MLNAAACGSMVCLQRQTGLYSLPPSVLHMASMCMLVCVFAPNNAILAVVQWAVTWWDWTELGSCVSEQLS